MTKISIPKFRFSRFNDEWKENKLNEVADRVTRKNKNLDSDLPLTISAQYGLIDQETFFNKKVASKDLSNYFLVKHGEFAYNKSYSNGYPFGTIKSLKRYDKGVLSSLYIVFSIKKNISHLFMDSFFDSNHWHKEVSTKTTEGARNHGLLNISPNDFMSSRIYIPKNIVEQERIGSFFEKIDKIIELQTQKLEQLKKLKQGYLQKMFPEDGKLLPRLRFSGFSEEWKEDKLGNVYNINTGRSVYNSSNHGKYPIAGSTGVIGYDNEFDYDGNFLLVARVGDAGSTYCNSGKMKITDNTIFIEAEYENFLSGVLKNKNIKKFSVGSGRKLIKSSDLKKINVVLPEKREQLKIDIFLIELNSMIDVQDEKISNLKQQKKAYLQKMFI